MILERGLRKRALSGEYLRGVLLRAPAEELIEIVSAAGVDFILLDCEHGPSDEIDIRQSIAAAALFGVETIVRIGEGDESLILRALDSGASGIVFPHAESADELHALAVKAKYPPEGNRGFALYSRAAGYGTSDASEYKVQMNESVMLVGMLESPAAASKAPDILSSPLIDAYMVGTSDLAASRTASDASTAELTMKIHQTTAASKKIRLDIVSSADEAKIAREDGAQLIVYNFTALVVNAIKDLP